MNHKPSFARIVLRQLLPLVLLVGVALPHATAYAFEPFALLIPCRATAVNTVGTERPCITCHNNPDGGSGCATPPCFNPFGMAFDANGRTWDATLAAGDADGDGYTNGEELGDPTGVWRVGAATPMCDCATRPGFPAFTPGDTDADSDGYCCIGSDMDGNGDCLGATEHDGNIDCDESNAEANSAAAEMCTNPIDNDCDGLPTLLDADCASVVDRDGDGYCPMGLDMNRDRDCIDPGEMTSDVDCDDDEVTVSPAAGENCLDSLDNDCDMAIDSADSDCTSDTDADMDGYCPIGRDINGDGDCNDTVSGTSEVGAGFDCDDSAAAVNSGATEICADFLDNDCDGLADFRDSEDCASFFDADGDGYCPTGRDVNGNGNCIDPGEDAEPGDCDDMNPMVNPGLMEACLDTDVDEDCDGDISLADADCAGYIDTDGDSFCFIGGDMDGDGFCTGPGEQSGDGDCDESNTEIRPTATEICTDGIDNDCDGSTDGAQRGACDRYRDVDGDGWCLEGQDIDGDGFCDDAGEQDGLSEWDGDMDPHSPAGTPGTEGNPSRYPGAPEHCRNGIDEDLDGMIDESAYCRSDVDADGDGFCPLGTDMNRDGDCDDEGEQTGLDCNDSDETINTGEDERCLEPVDADCDSRVGTLDEDCFFLLDRDGDGICGMGTDDNADGDCLDDAEDRFGVDCDDENPMVSSRQREVCDDGIDNDCDGDIDFRDSFCACEDNADCDDGDGCTVDMCNPDGSCSNEPELSCGDGGVPLDGGPMVEPPGDGCSCRAVGGGGRSSGLLWFGLAVVFLWRGRRRG